MVPAYTTMIGFSGEKIFWVLRVWGCNPDDASIAFNTRFSGNEDCCGVKGACDRLTMAEVADGYSRLCKYGRTPPKRAAFYWLGARGAEIIREFKVIESATGTDITDIDPDWITYGEYEISDAKKNAIWWDRAKSSDYVRLMTGLRRHVQETDYSFLSRFAEEHGFIAGHPIVDEFRHYALLVKRFAGRLSRLPHDSSEKLYLFYDSDLTEVPPGAHHPAGNTKP